MRLAESDLSDRVEATSNVITSRGDDSNRALLDATFDSSTRMNNTTTSRRNEVKAELLRSRLSRAAEARSRIAELESSSILSAADEDDGRRQQHLLNLAREEYELEMQAVNRIEKSLLSGQHGDGVIEGESFPFTHS